MNKRAKLTQPMMHMITHADTPLVECESSNYKLGRLDKKTETHVRANKVNPRARYLR